MRGQVSIDLLFALAIVAITMLSLVNIAAGEYREAQVIDASAQLRAFAIDLRGTVARLYSSPGMTVIKEAPLPLGPGEWINVTLREDGYLRISARIGNLDYTVVQELQVPPGRTSSVLLTANASRFAMTSRWGENGVEVTLEGPDGN